MPTGLLLASKFCGEEIILEILNISVKVIGVSAMKNYLQKMKTHYKKSQQFQKIFWPVIFARTE